MAGYQGKNETGFPPHNVYKIQFRIKYLNVKSKTKTFLEERTAVGKDFLRNKKSWLGKICKFNYLKIKSVH